MSTLAHLTFCSRILSCVLRLCTGSLAKAVFLVLLLAMLYYCFQEQMAVSLSSIHGLLGQQNNSRYRSSTHSSELFDDTLPASLEERNVSESHLNNGSLDSTSYPVADSIPEVSEIQSWGTTTNSMTTDAGDDDGDVTSTSCVFPHINPFDPNIMKMAGLDHKTVVCNSSEVDLAYVDGSSLVINKTLVEEKHGKVTVYCKYRNIQRKDREDNSLELSGFSSPFTDSLKLPADAEFILVVCEGDLTAKSSTQANTSPVSLENLTVLSRTYYSLVPRHEKLEKVESLLMKKRIAETSPKETMNIVMIGLDGVPRHQFIRAMNRTYGLLMKDFSSFDMSMYTQVGVNTFPNFMALLGGRLEEEVYSWWDFKKYTDGFDLIWYDMQKAGYRTLYTEDVPSIGAFHYEKIGFLKTPTVHFSRPLALAIERDGDITKSGKHCVGNRPEVSFHFDYILRYLETFPDKPLYAMSFSTKITHDDMTNLKMIDDHVFEFYAALNASGHLNNTLLVTFSDHGQRWGSIRSTFNGVIESRTPYAIFTLPKWFLEKYPRAARNLKLNTGRLTTHFDTYATLQDLLYFGGSGEIPLRRTKHGISLFQEIPKNRTCASIPIPADFCVCGQQSMNKLDTTSAVSKSLAKIVTDTINKKRDPALCEELRLDKIIEILYVKFPDDILKEKLDKSLFKVRIQTEPGGAIYEATVNAVVSDKSIVDSVMNWLGLSSSKISDVDVGHSIDRLNLYKGQADCIRDARQKPFCYCK